jgi:hypothetical protein
MTIRSRTERDVASGDGAVRIAGAVATVGLAAAGALHVLWASGSTWPAADAEALADVVIGRVPPEGRPDGDGGDRGSGGADRSLMPGAAASVAVAGLLGAAAALTAGASGLVPLPGRRTKDLAQLGGRVAAGVLLARGSGGLVLSSFGLGGASERFHRWNLRLYSPLCLGLGAATALSTRDR